MAGAGDLFLHRRLEVAGGLNAGEIAAAVGKSLLTVRRWRQRYVAKGAEGLLKDAREPASAPDPLRGGRGRVTARGCSPRFGID